MVVRRGRSSHSRIMLVHTGLIGQMTTKARHFAEAYLGSFKGRAQTKLSIAQRDMVMEVPYLSLLVNGPTCPCGDVKLVAFPS